MLEHARGLRLNGLGVAESRLDALNAEISRRMLATGYAGVFTTELAGKKVLRICAIHPEATEQDMRGTIRRLDTCCREALAELDW